MASHDHTADEPYTVGNLTITPLPQRVPSQKRLRRRDARPRHANPTYLSDQVLDGTKDSVEQFLPSEGLKGKAALDAMLADQAARGIVNESVPGRYEYKDHTADIQLHAWGDNLAGAFENVGVAMFGYMTQLDRVNIDKRQTVSFELKAESLEELLYNYLVQCLGYSTEKDLIVKEVKVLALDIEKFSLRVTLYGEKWDKNRHPQGTEVKAITYSALKILLSKNDDPKEDRDKAEVFVIVDI